MVKTRSVINLINGVVYYEILLLSENKKQKKFSK